MECEDDTSLNDHAVVADPPDGKLGVFFTQRYRDLVQLAEKRRIAGRFRAAAAEGRDINELLVELENELLQE